MHAVIPMELNVVLDTLCECGLLFCLCLEFAGGGRLQYWLLFPKTQVEPGSDLSWIVPSCKWSRSCVQQHQYYGQCREILVGIFCHQMGAPARRLCYWILWGRIAPKWYYVILLGIQSAWQRFVGWGSFLWLVIWEDPHRVVVSVINDA